MNIELRDQTTQQTYYVTTVHFESQTNPFGGFLWTSGTVPPLGEYLLLPFEYPVALTSPQGGDNHFKFHRL